MIKINYKIECSDITGKINLYINYTNNFPQSMKVSISNLEHYFTYPEAFEVDEKHGYIARHKIESNEQQGQAKHVLLSPNEHYTKFFIFNKNDIKLTEAAYKEVTDWQEPTNNMKICIPEHWISWYDPADTNINAEWLVSSVCESIICENTNNL